MKIAIMGFGVVGSGVYEVVKSLNNSRAKNVTEPVEVKRILDLRDFSGLPYADLFTDKFDDIISDGEIEAAAEVMGGITPAYDYTKRLLQSGRSVITSNKELVAKHGTELLQIAHDNGVHYMFEASVGGGIPIIRPLINCLAANEITEVMGILNGTTNYILTRMIKDSQTFDEALKGAQEAGYAERDPSSDVEGKDTCRKLAILSSIAFGRFADSDKIAAEGITKITLADVAYAESIGRSVKLVGLSKKVGNGMFAAVCPMMLEGRHPLGGVEDVFNGILVRGSASGDVMFYGRGAGKLPTASAVVADIIDVTKHRDIGSALLWTDAGDYMCVGAELDAVKFARYIRVAADAGKRDGAMRRILDIVPDCEFIRLSEPEYVNEFAVITRAMPRSGYARVRRKFARPTAWMRFWGKLCCIDVERGVIRYERFTDEKKYTAKRIRLQPKRVLFYYNLCKKP